MARSYYACSPERPNPIGASQTKKSEGLIAMALTKDERVRERQRLEAELQIVLGKSCLFDEMKVSEYKKMAADLHDVLHKWTTREVFEDQKR